MMQPQEIITAARAYMGVRFRHQGRSKQMGVDCLGLLVCISQDLGITWPAQLHHKMQERDYSHMPDEAYLRESIEAFLQPSMGAMQTGDIALLRVQGRVQHLGIIASHPITGNDTLIHAYAPARKVIEHALDRHWQSAIVTRYTLPDIAH